MRLLSACILISSAILCTRARNLSAEAAGHRYLRTIDGQYLRSDTSHWQVDLTPNKEPCTQWYVIDLHGKVAVKSYCSPFRLAYLSSQHDGTVELFSLRMDNEKWTPFKNDDGSWSFQSSQGGWLSAERNGSVRSDSDSSSHFWLETWAGGPNRNLSKEAAGSQYVKSMSGFYLSANENPRAIGIESTTRCEQWYIEDHFGEVAFKLHCSPGDEKYLSAPYGGSVVITEYHSDDCLWTPFKNVDGTWSFISSADRWLVYDRNGSVFTVNDEEGSRRNFKLQSMKDPEGASMTIILLAVFMTILFIAGIIFVAVKMRRRNITIAANNFTNPTMTYTAVDDAMECDDGPLVE